MVERKNTSLPEQEGNEHYRIRLEKLRQLRKIGIEPYPGFFQQTHHSEEIISNPDIFGQRVSVAGRIMSIRKMGKTNFAHIKDAKGQIQIYLNIDSIKEEGMSFFNRYIDIGDIVGVKGEVFKTRTSEVTVKTDELTLLSKSLRPLPSKFYGLKDQETIYRERYLDLLVNPQSKERFDIRIKLIRNIRAFLDAQNFIEVETPILQPEASGAVAKPFITHHYALDKDLYLRIAPETYLKRLLVGGYERVYEIGRTFRNEGIDSSHLQDFTMLEFYAAYWCAETNIRFTQNLLREVITNATGRNTLIINGQEINLAKEWPINTYRDILLEHSGVDIYDINSPEELFEKIESKEIHIEGLHRMNMGQAIDKLFKSTARPNLIQPQILTEYPAVLSPLARGLDEKPNYVDQFQLLIAGWEIAKGYSELIDPIEQRGRLIIQAHLRAGGDEEAMPLDEDYIKSMEYGMPPNSGVGIGIDRLTAILTGTDNLRDVVFFPLTKPK